MIGSVGPPQPSEQACVEGGGQLPEAVQGPPPAAFASRSGSRRITVSGIASSYDTVKSVSKAKFTVTN